MRRSAQYRRSIREVTQVMTVGAFAILLIILPTQIQAQTYHVLYAFNGGLDGAEPWAGITVDAAGNLYGATMYGGGSNNRGTVFKLKHNGSGWIINPLYSFIPSDGQYPEARVIIGPNGTLYGTNTFGGAFDHGTVYNVRPPANPCRATLCPWAEIVLYSFTGLADGGDPGYGDLNFDHAGNLYGTTTQGGANRGGVIYELQRSGGSWMESVLYSLDAYTSGIYPYSGVIFDSAGNLYGTATAAGGGSGAVFRLTPSGSGWVENTLYTFPRDESTGAGPYGTVVFDQSGNLYGTTALGGAYYAGTVYELTPSGGNWIESVLYSFADYGPYVGLTMDAAGNLYGT